MVTKTKTKQTQVEADAARWQAIAPHLPEILKRGVESFLKEQASADEPGLSAGAATAPIEAARLIDWQNMPNVDLLATEPSEARDAERLRRSFEAFEQFNEKSEFQIPPTPALVASFADVEAAYVLTWLRQNERLEKAEEYIESLGFEDEHQATTATRVELSRRGFKSARDVVKWSEAAYGEYEW